MVIYEVNLKINNEVFTQFMQWLSLHVEEVLRFPGFVKALHLRNFDEDNNITKNITIQYFLNSPKSLDNYFEKYAETMREKGISKFPNQFVATRRILEVQEEIIADG
ncbi:MAG: DUF4286 family protein [Legionellaceae bacterium]|nr:DUF4286 family protein [Legionellaceae bacterium]